MILSGDVGGTKTNLALFDDFRQVEKKRYENQEYSGFSEILKSFLKEFDSKIDKVCIGAAGRITEGTCSLTNLPWQLDVVKLKEKLNLDSVWLINDLVATACAVPFLNSYQVKTLQEGSGLGIGRISVVSAGTDLGIASLVPDSNGKFLILDSEGGHCDFSPRNNVETDLLLFLQKKYSRVSIGRILSGTGLLNIYEYLTIDKENKYEVISSPQTIVDKAFAKQSEVCEKALNLFVSVYGAIGGNVALQYLSNGGVYIGGGIAPKILPIFKESIFLHAFRSNLKFENYLSQIPVKVILDESAPLIGAARYAMGQFNINL
jgi:glucokinase